MTPDEFLKAILNKAQFQEQLQDVGWANVSTTIAMQLYYSPARDRVRIKPVSAEARIRHFLVNIRHYSQDNLYANADDILGELNDY